MASSDTLLATGALVVVVILAAESMWPLLIIKTTPQCRPVPLQRCEFRSWQMYRKDWTNFCESAFSKHLICYRRLIEVLNETIIQVRSYIFKNHIFNRILCVRPTESLGSPPTIQYFENV